MSTIKTKNAALTTALAFHYQVLIGLDSCFSLEDGQRIWFELDGDVSLLSSDSSVSIQTEVKDYASPLTDHHENLWKTLKNWLEPAFEHHQYGVLVLHTTQAFGKTTRLKNWNALSSAKRLAVLKEIFAERSEEEVNAEKVSEVIKHQKSVMAYDSNVLETLLTKVTLYTEADSSQKLQEKVKSYLVGIPPSNRKSYLDGLVGFVYGQASNQSWSICYKDFTAKCEELTARLCKKEFTFPAFSGQEASESEIEQHQDRDFVKKITDINHNVMITDAVGNWIELQNSLIEQLDEYPLYRKQTVTYQNRLVKKFQLQYSNAQLEDDDVIKSSKRLYNNTIGEQALNMGDNIPPIEYKNGLIHDAMDDEERELQWRVEK
ncbi:hypothetical protein [Pseudoalteromonas sp. MMG012]|uniref:hypothetical protein n=1 Tax=Pseudoalteromonas sp. MMG012 TaxID=2822686 RepID=UPI001B3A1DD9|nr:hypothetical protein [Pseudoalteromonas sp. MMG012]MBQ4851043.1 hypothetical protein [Pseudoalteromonas sp. MMG012]